VTEQGPGTRTGASTPDRRLPVVALGVAVLCTLLMAAFALIGMRPDGSSQAPLEGRIDKLYSHALGLAMFEREYGVVQQHLQDYQAEGLIERAVVADRSGAVIAAISPPDSARVGDRLGNDLAAGTPSPDRRGQARARTVAQLDGWRLASGAAGRRAAGHLPAAIQKSLGHNRAPAVTALAALEGAWTARASGSRYWKYAW
jgi:hypothetical protein